MRRTASVFMILAAIAFTGLAYGGSQASAEAQKAPPPGEPTFQGGTGPDFAAGRILVKPGRGVPDSALDSLNRENGARTKERLPGTRVRVVNLPPDLTVEAAVERYERSPDIAYAEPDTWLAPTRTVPNDPGFGQLYGLDNTGQTIGGVDGSPDADIDAPEAWDSTTGSSSTLVAVVDTGVDISHPDLKNNIWTNPGETGLDANGNDKATNGVDDDKDGYIDDVHGWDFYNDDNTVYDSADGDEHGTHVAGTIAAEGNNGTGVTGVNWRAKVMPLKFLGPNGGYTSDAVKAIEYAIDKDVKISSNSWGCGGTTCYSQTLKDEISKAGDAGLLFVAAAGNDGADTDATPFYPASYDDSNIISVAATNNRDELASFSNYGGTSVDLGAPGVNILSTVPDNSYAYYSGTSMATPHVSGVAALIESQNPAISVSQMKSRILESAEPVSSLQGKSVTGGRLNAAGALGIRLTELSLSASPRTITFGHGTTLSGKLTSNGEPLAGRTVVLERRPVGASDFSKVGEATTASDGTYSLAGLKPGKNTYYRAHFAGESARGIRPSTSAVRRVGVRVVVTLNTASTDLKLGRSRTISGAVKPRHGGAVTLHIKRNGELISNKKLALDSFSRYSITYKPPRKGHYAFYATYPKHTDHLWNRSPQKAFRAVE